MPDDGPDSQLAEVDRRRRVGLVVNPIAGMGGRVGLKGTDAVVDRAVALGAEPSAHFRARRTLVVLRQLLTSGAHPVEIVWLTCAGPMGSDHLAGAGFDDVTILWEPGPTTSAADTERAAARFIEAGAELIVFCGGDGTARDVVSVTGDAVPILGIPAGVKMFSGVFGVSPDHTARILFDHLAGRLELAEVDILDIDEERYRHGELAIRLYATARTPFEPSLTQTAKALVTDVGESDVRQDIANDLIERMDAERGTLFLLGPGSTVAAVARRLAIDKTLLGVDAVVDRRRIGADLGERDVLELLDAHRRSVMVLSPIGAQGFVLGRGNQQLSPDVVRRIGPANLIVIATPAKLRRTPVLRFDTGDRDLDAQLGGKGYRAVVTGYHVSRLVKVAA